MHNIFHRRNQSERLCPLKDIVERFFVSVQIVILQIYFDKMELNICALSHHI